MAVQATTQPRMREPAMTHRAWRRREMIYGYLMIVPNLFGFLAFLFGPIIFALAMSFTTWDLISPPDFVGLTNYTVRMVNDDQFWLSLGHTAYFAILAVPLGVIVGLCLALIANQALRLIAFYRAAFFVPVITSAVAIALIWRVLYNTEFGLVNYLLELLHLPPQGWLSDRDLVIPSISLVWVYKNMGYNMIIFLAGLKGIPATLYEAAAIDGAGRFQRFRHITLPLLTPATFFVLIMTVLGSFQVFDLVYLMTNGGPGDASRVYYFWLWQNSFRFFRMGYAAAMAWVLFGILFLITLAQVRVLGQRVQYELV